MTVIGKVAFIAVAVLAAVPGVRAQPLIACTGGMAGGFPCGRLNLASNLPIATFDAERANDIWGWTDPLDQSEYALVGLDNGVAFVDVTNPVAPVYLGKLPTATFASIWRDIKVFQNYAFVVADGAASHGMQVFDLTRLRAVASPPEIFASDADYNGVAGNQPNSTHNIAINEASGFAYLVGSGDCAGGLHMVDIADPMNPQFAGCFSADGYTHDVQCVNYAGPDPDYLGREICVASNEDTVTLVDVTDKSNPVQISQGLYPSPAYTHQGWFTEDHRYFLVDDELDEITGATSNTRTVIFDMEDLDAPEFHAFYFGLSGSSDHNLYIRDNHAFLSNYNSGLRILDLTNIELGAPTEKAFFDTYPQDDTAGFEGQWSNYPFFESENIILNDGTNGLFVVTPDFPLDTAAQAPPEIPAEDGYLLEAAYPNPFNTTTRFALSVARSQHVEVEVLDVAGRRMFVAFEAFVPAGARRIIAVDASTLPAGLYLLRVTGEEFSTSRRVSLVR